MTRTWPFIAVLPICAALSAGLAEARDSPRGRPAACKPQVTVQMLACRVDHVYTCPDGTVWTDTFEGDMRGAQLDHVTITTADGDLIWQGMGPDGVAATNDKPAFSIARAMKEGAFKFTMPLEFHISGVVTPSVSEGTVTPVPGTIWVTGHEFHRFDVYQETRIGKDGPALTTRDVNYYDPKLGFVIFGEAETTVDDKRRTYNWVPFAILNPGDDGFLSPLPKYGCGELSMNPVEEKAIRS